MPTTGKFWVKPYQVPLGLHACVSVRSCQMRLIMCRPVHPIKQQVETCLLLDPFLLINTLCGRGPALTGSQSTLFSGPSNSQFSFTNSWLEIYNDGWYLYFFTSSTGYEWNLVYSSSIASGFGADPITHAGFGMNPNGNDDRTYNLCTQFLSWQLTTGGP